MKRITIGFIFILILALTLGNFAFATETDSKLPELKLSVEQSLLAIYPPYMIYTAQLSFVPPLTTSRLIADFYNINSNADSVNNRLEYLGSIPFDKSGQAVLSKQLKPGYYIAVAKTVINGVTIWSNKVEYKVY